MKSGKFNGAIYYFPFVYMFKSRYKTLAEKISWMIIYALPILIIAYSFNVSYLLFSTIYLLSIISFVTLYEIGYLENDIVTTQKEKDPQIRIEKDKNIKFIHEKYSNLVICRYFLVGLLLLILCLLYFVFPGLEIYMFQFIIFLILTRFIFKLHNIIRNRFNILTYFLLVSLKYLTPISLFINFKDDFISILGVLVIFPVVRTIEHSTKPKYNLVMIQKKIANKDLFRVIYYLALSLLIALIYLLKVDIFMNDKILAFFAVSLIFLTYRLSILFLTKYRSKLVDHMRKSKTY